MEFITSIMKMLIFAILFGIGIRIGETIFDKLKKNINKPVDRN